MFDRSLLRFSAVTAAFTLLFVTFAFAQENTNPHPRKYKVPPPAARIEVRVIRDANGKPIENAAVIFHPLEGDTDKGALEVKTNEDGKTVIDVIPIGDTVRMQIIASGFQTYGEDYKVDKDQITKEVRMKRPGQQYSIYNQGDGKSQNAPKDQAPSKPSTPDAPK
jgi:5-hydroxyisourate hydrolase-like protein (transthyretin family)